MPIFLPVKGNERVKDLSYTILTYKNIVTMCYYVMHSQHNETLHDISYPI